MLQRAMLDVVLRGEEVIVRAVRFEETIAPDSQ
jgi:hypothetical protein